MASAFSLTPGRSLVSRENQLHSPRDYIIRRQFEKDLPKMNETHGSTGILIQIYKGDLCTLKRTYLPAAACRLTFFVIYITMHYGICPEAG